MNNKRRWRSMYGLSLAISLTGALALAWPTPAWAPNCSTCSDVIQTLTLPIAGITHFVPGNPCRTLGGVEENVSWAGWIVVHTNVDFDPGVVDIHAKLALMDVMGVGQSSGWMFLVPGGSAFESQVKWPAISADPLLGGRAFDYFPADPIGRKISQCMIHNGLGVFSSLMFQSDGTLQPQHCNDFGCTGTSFSISNP